MHRIRSLHTIATAAALVLAIQATVGSAAGSIVKVSKAGGDPTVLARQQKTPRSVAVGGELVFWTNAGTDAENGTDGSVGRMGKDGSDPKVLASGQISARHVMLDEAQVYWVAYDDKTGQEALRKVHR